MPATHTNDPIACPAPVAHSASKDPSAAPSVEPPPRHGPTAPRRPRNAARSWLGLLGLLLLAACSRAPETPDLGDLPQMQQRGTLRVLLPYRDAADRLPRGGTFLEVEQGLVADFARNHGMVPMWVYVDARSDLLPSLLAGKGDMVIANLTVTRERKKQVAFTVPVDVVREQVVVRSDDAGVKRVRDLQGRRVAVRRSSSFWGTLENLRKTYPKIQIEPVPEYFDTEEVLDRVATGEYDLTIADSNLVDSVLAYRTDLQIAFPLGEERPVAWAVRPKAAKLVAALDRFIYENRLMEKHPSRSTEDLAGIKKRGVLRVLTRNSATTYFLWKGQFLGFEYELARNFAEAQGLRLEMVVPPSRADLVPWLLEGRGDIIAAAVPLTEERRRTPKLAFSRPYNEVTMKLVSRAGEPQLHAVEELAGRTLVVRRSSPLWDLLVKIRDQGLDPTQAPPVADDDDEPVERADIGPGDPGSTNGETPMAAIDANLLPAIAGLAEDTAAAEVPEAPPPATKRIPLQLVAAPEEIETEEIIAKVAAGEYDLTVAQSHILDIELTWRDDIQADLTLSKPVPQAWAVRAENRKLLGAIDEFFDQEHRGVFYNMAYRKYFKDPRRIRKHVEMRSANTGTLSPYDDLIRRYAEQYGFDWRLIVAQMFHESRLDPTAKSWAGAEGLLQVLPSTAKALGFHNLGDLETGIHAGIKYLNQLRGKLDADIPLQERTWLALAAYNAGFGHLADARRLAKRLGLDPNRWTDNVEKAMLLLSRDKYARQAKNGYCRCSEPVAYVRDIRARYDAYARTGPDQLVEKVGEPRDASVAEITESER